MGIARPSSARGKRKDLRSLSPSLSLTSFLRGLLPLMQRRSQHVGGYAERCRRRPRRRLCPIRGKLLVGPRSATAYLPPFLTSFRLSWNANHLIPPLPHLLCLSWSIDRTSPSSFAHGGIEHPPLSCRRRRPSFLPSVCPLRFRHVVVIIIILAIIFLIHEDGVSN